jgi:preprotein translocase subunit SecG
MDMGFVWVIIIWLVSMIILAIYHIRKEKQENITISQEAIRRYEGGHRK